MDHHEELRGPVRAGPPHSLDPALAVDGAESPVVSLQRTILDRIVEQYSIGDPTVTDGPHFKRPPVREVVCGLQFSGAEGWRTPHFGAFWEHVRGEYSQFEDHPPLDPLRLDSSTPAQIRFTQLPPLRRVFFIQPPGNFLIQLQQNRILHNWRRVAESDQYPRFDTAYPKFVLCWEQLRHFMISAGLSEPQPEFFELTYMNHIAEADAAFPRDIWKFLAFYQSTPEAVIATKDSSAMSMHFEWALPDEMGVLIFDLKHGLRPNDESEVLLIELSARGKSKPGEHNMKTWFDVAHGAIVNTFDALTTEFAHDLWGKIGK